MQAGWPRVRVDTGGPHSLLLPHLYPGLPGEWQRWERGTRQTLECGWTCVLMTSFSIIFLLFTHSTIH